MFRERLECNTNWTTIPSVGGLYMNDVKVYYMKLNSILLTPECLALCSTYCAIYILQCPMGHGWDTTPPPSSQYGYTGRKNKTNIEMT